MTTESKIASATPPAESTDRRLHRLYDGDLSTEERAALEKEIAGDPALEKKLEGLREVGVVVHAARTEGAGEIDSEALWKAIEGTIASATPPVEATIASATPPVEATIASATPPVEATIASATPPVEATIASATPPVEATIASATPPVEATIASATPPVEATIASATPATEAPAAKPALRAIEGGAADKPAEDPRARRRRYIGVGVGMFAIAAAALLMIYGPPDAPPDTIAETTPDTTTPDTIAPEERPEAVAGTIDYTEVLAVDFGTNVGTIFAVEGEGGQRYAVVWLDDVLKRDESELPVEAPSTPD